MNPSSPQNQVSYYHTPPLPYFLGIEFQKDFITQIKLIFKQIFRIFAHIFHQHYDKIVQLSCQSHLNTLFGHFIAFAKGFELLEKKEWGVMGEFIRELEGLDRI